MEEIPDDVEPDVPETAESVVCEEAVKPAFGLVFGTMAAVIEEMNRYANVIGFQISRSCKNMTAEQVKRHMPHVKEESDKIPFRGYFYCGTGGTQQLTKKRLCRFYVGFTYFDGAYRIKDTDPAFCTEHDHQCTPQIHDGLLKWAADLTPEERADILKLGVDVDTPTIYRILSSWYPGRQFAPSLLAE